MPVGEHHRFNQRLLSETSEDDYPLSPTSPPTTPSPINGSPLSSGGGDQSATNLAPGPLELFFGDDHTIKGERISRQSEGVSLYLRLGAVGFGFGVMIFDGFKLAEPWEGPTVSSCHDVFWIPNHVIHFIYVFWQTYFLFKHHQTIVEEISSESEKAESAPHSSAHSPMHFTTTTVSPMDVGLHEANLTHGLHSNHTVCHSTAKRMAPYLFPCVIEYSLIALAMFYKMFQKVGHVHEESERMERMRQAKSLGRNYTECHRAHKGLFIGLLFFMATLVAMCLFFIFIEDHGKRQLALLVYQSTELTLIAMAILISLACLVKLRKLKFSQLSEEGAFDDNLLLVGLMGMLFYDLFLLIPTFDPPTDPDQRRVAQLFTAKAVLEIVQSLFQVYLILEATRRCAGSLLDVRNKPGRTLVTLLLILNLAMWVVNTFEVKRADSHGLQKTFYSEIAWRIITNIALPLIVFFRFHSTVCLADVWANAYRFHERAK